jgi:hypothetical protein
LRDGQECHFHGIGMRSRRLHDYQIVFGMWASIILHIVWLAIHFHGTTAQPVMDDQTGCHQMA